MIKLTKILAPFLLTLCLVVVVYLNHKMVVSLAKSPRVLCLVTTTPKNHMTKARAVSETWGQRCDILVFVSSQKEEGLPIIDVKCEKDSHSFLWCKNRKGTVQAHNMFAGQYDWFYKADDDTYAIMENLKHLVGGYEPTDPIWFGCPLNFPIQDHVKYMSGGPGFVSSHEAMVRLMKSFETPRKGCNATQEYGSSDLTTGRCLVNTGVEFGDEKDEFNKPRFFPFAPYAWFNPHNDIYKSAKWLKQYGVHQYKMGSECCSETSIAFHYISANDMYVYDFFLYRMKVMK